ncbi:MAG: chorismate synthase [Lachnospiraceae bacterium]|nr:chorismate synthase [Lachnospiraceae bacterium]
MAGSIFGKLFCISTFGESHGNAIGVTIDGCPAGLSLSEQDIQKYLDRRKPGQSKYTTKRAEGDEVQILSGVFEGKTLGTPISLVVFNKDQRSKDYTGIAESYRPGHADFTFDEKYGFRDYRGGGRSSGRETIGRVAAGAVATKILEELGISVTAYTKAIGPYEIDYNNFDLSFAAEGKLYMPDKAASEKTEKFLDECIENQDSAGGVIECVIKGLPAGLGETVFDKLDANLAKAVMSIGAVKGFEIGAGFGAAKLKGSENNDPFKMADGKVTKLSNNAGGILGGMSDGSDITFRAAVKPTPSISRMQTTVNTSGEDISMSIMGRHDPVIVPRAVVVVECMAALVLVDALFANMSAKLSGIKDFYNK